MASRGTRHLLLARPDIVQGSRGLWHDRAKEDGPADAWLVETAGFAGWLEDAYGFLPHFLFLGTVPTTLVLGDCRDYPCARGLSRPLSCSRTVQTTIVLGDCLDHHRAQGLSRPPSCSGTVPTTLMLGDCSDQSPNIARRPLSSVTCDLYSHTVKRHLFFLT